MISLLNLFLLLLMPSSNVIVIQFESPKSKPMILNLEDGHYSVNINKDGAKYAKIDFKLDLLNKIKELKDENKRLIEENKKLMIQLNLISNKNKKTITRKPLITIIEEEIRPIIQLVEEPIRPLINILD